MQNTFKSIMRQISIVFSLVDEMINWQLVAVIISGAVVVFLLLICCFCCCIIESLKYSGRHHYPVIHKPHHPNPIVLHDLSISERLTRDGYLHTSRPHYYGHNYGYDSDEDSCFSDDPVDDYVRESEDRLRRLAQGISHSPYLNPNLNVSNLLIVCKSYSKL